MTSGRLSYSLHKISANPPPSYHHRLETDVVMAPPDDYQAHPFFQHLIALLSVYELYPHTPPIPRYEGPSDWYILSISRSLEKIARRMITAENFVSSFEASQKSGPETKKRRSIGDSPPLASSGSSPSTSNTTATLQSPFFTPPQDVAMSTTDTDSPPRQATARTPSPMTISLDGVVNPLDNSNKAFNINMGNGTSSAPPTYHAEHTNCPTCGKAVTDNTMLARITALHGPPVSSPLIIPPGPLAAAAFESGMSAVEELRLLKAQVQDVAKVCNAVARGDLSQKITVPVQGVVMAQLKEVINGMVEKLGQFAKEVTRVSLEVGTEGWVLNHIHTRLSSFSSHSQQQTGRSSAGSRCRRHMARAHKCRQQLGWQLDQSGTVYRKGH